MFSLNRVTLIGNTGDDAKVIPNGPTTISLATNVSWIDKKDRGTPHSRRVAPTRDYMELKPFSSPFFF